MHEVKGTVEFENTDVGFASGEGRGFVVKPIDLNITEVSVSFCRMFVPQDKAAHFALLFEELIPEVVGRLCTYALGLVESLGREDTKTD